MTIGLLYHGAAVLIAAMAAQPSSPLEQEAHGAVAPYLELTNLDRSYRYYSPEPPPTEIIEATLTYRDGRPPEVVRLPDRAVRPRLRYQRQLALAHYIHADFEEARENTEAHDGSLSKLAASVARHLGATHPGCSAVSLSTRLHLNPPYERVRDLRAASRGKPVDLDAEEFYTAPQRIGEFPCDAS